MLLPLLATILLAPDTTFNTYCMDCHGDGMAKGDFALDELIATPGVDDADHWLALRSRLRHRDMPPEGKPRPTEAEYIEMERWVSERIETLAAEAAAPGRIGPRRLNNVEYAATIQDLFDVTIDTEDRFPADGAGEGFDTTADVLTLPPLLLEKYFDAAELVARRAVRDEDHPEWTERTVSAEDLATTGRVALRNQVQRMTSRGTAGATFDLPRSGQYTIRVGAYGDQAGDEPVRLKLWTDNTSRGVIDVPSTRSDPGVHEHVVELPSGQTEVRLEFVNDYYRPDDPDPSQRDRNAAVQWMTVIGPTDQVVPTAFQDGLPAARPGEPIATSLRRMLASLLPRVWRRPVGTDEIDALVRLAAETGGAHSTLTSQLRTCITAMLVSPSFLFRVELDSDGLDSSELSGHELATRLSYFLWSTTPDDALQIAARDGALATPDGRRQAVLRMLADPRSVALAEHFATQWLQIRSLPERTPDPRRFPGIDPALLHSMQQETIALFDDVIRTRRSIWDLLESDSTIVDERLASHYGWTWPDTGVELHRFDIDLDRPRGIFGHASILTATSNPTRTSPVKRGKWILEALLDDPPPPPPPGIDALPEVADDQAELAQQDLLARHNSDPTCRACHARMDPLGLAMEAYDAVGRRRPVDMIANMNLEATLPGGRTFEGAGGLQELLIGDSAFLRSIARHMLVYALGRGTTFADEALILHLVAALEKEPTMHRLILEIVESDAFRFRSEPVEDAS